jgi:DNA helicase IV
MPGGIRDYNFLVGMEKDPAEINHRDYIKKMERRQTESARTGALRVEQAHVSMLYERLDIARERAEAALREAHGRGGQGGTHQARIEREVSAVEHARRLAQLSGVERGLCFGRIDDTEGDTYYIGRIGLRGQQNQLVLIDWRAPAARPFYTATPNDPGSLVRRRHLHTRARTVVGIDDEVFDLDRMAETDRRTLVGEAALMAALRRGRTGRMSEVVATIQTEQDRVIRSGLPGALVVQGGPGTGKTVAALHRAAYLLYAHRGTLERRGVLVVGPNAMFLRYISQVLPSLGETDVVLATVGELHPGVRAMAADGPAAAVVKGDLRMATVVKAAVRARQRVPRGGLEIVTEDLTLRLPSDICARARDRARALRRPHNVSRKLFVQEMLTALVRAEAGQLDRPVDTDDLPYLRSGLWEQDAVRQALDRLWPFLTPERLISELLSDAARLRSAASGKGGLSPQEQQAVLRPAGSPWTTGDVPLLDEAAWLLGEDDTAARAMRRQAERERRAEEEYAYGVLELTGLSELGVMEARTLAERHRGGGASTTTAERAAGDRGWAYGHVIVDEAQELSAMAWRTVMRRVPTRSLTVVGDIAQRSSAAGARSWGEMLDRYVKGRWREERLTVNYRTSAEIMEVAADVLKAVAPEQEPPESVRSGEAAPRALLTTGPELADALAGLVKAELAEIGDGRLAVITADARHAEIAALISDAATAGPAEAAAVAEPADALDSPVVVLTVPQSKGLEFDAVVVVAPGEILAQSPMGGHDLYVAMTRATTRLTVVAEGALPDVLSRLATPPRTDARA